jgi:hypothetical protein
MFYFRLSVTFGLEITRTIGETKRHNYEVISTMDKKKIVTWQHYSFLLLKQVLERNVFKKMSLVLPERLKQQSEPQKKITIFQVPLNTVIKYLIETLQPHLNDKLWLIRSREF